MGWTAARRRDQLAADHQHPVILALDIVFDDDTAVIVAGTRDRGIIA